MELEDTTLYPRLIRTVTWHRSTCFWGSHGWLEAFGLGTQFSKSSSRLLWQVSGNRARVEEQSTTGEAFDGEFAFIGHVRVLAEEYLAQKEDDPHFQAKRCPRNPPHTFLNKAVDDMGP